MGNLLIYSATEGNFCIWPQARPRRRTGSFYRVPRNWVAKW